MVSISTLIQELEKVREKHGNIPIAIQDDRNKWVSKMYYMIAETDDGGNYVPNIEPETKIMFIMV